MQRSLTNTEIISILDNCKETLKFVQSSPNYQKIESSERFTTSNDLRLGDAIQSLSEVSQAIGNIEFQENHASDAENAFRSTFTS